MKRKRFTEEQIIGILNEHEAGIPVADLCRKHGVSDASIYKWKARFGGMDVSEAKRLRTLEDENTKLKRLLADAMLDNAAMIAAGQLSAQSADCRAASLRASSASVCWSTRPHTSSQLGSRTPSEFAMTWPRERVDALVDLLDDEGTFAPVNSPDTPA